MATPAAPLFRATAGRGRWWRGGQRWRWRLFALGDVAHSCALLGWNVAFRLRGCRKKKRKKKEEKKNFTAEISEQAAVAVIIWMFGTKCKWSAVDITLCNATRHLYPTCLYSTDQPSRCYLKCALEMNNSLILDNIQPSTRDMESLWRVFLFGWNLTSAFSHQSCGLFLWPGQMLISTQ